jgi:hypothetical protein
LRTNHATLLPPFQRWKATGLTVCATTVIAFAAGSIFMAYLTQLPGVMAAAGDRVFELNVYHAVPGKVAALESRFGDAWKLQAKHGLNVIGYWIPEGGGGWENTLVYMVAHRSREEAKKNWDAFHADPAFQKYVQSEKAEKLIDSVDTIYLRPADFSPMR